MLMKSIPLNQRKISIVYEAFITALAVASIILLAVPFLVSLSAETENIFDILDTCILVVFIIDYVVRFMMAVKKFEFFKKNIPDLISIIPFSQIFRAFRIVRIVRVFRLLKAGRIFVLFGKIGSRSKALFKTNNLNYVLYITLGLILLGAFGVCFAENKPFGDALWWSFVTVTTVGYGDISPSSTAGRFIAVVLMITGIGFISTLTSAIATYFLKPAPKAKSSVRQDVIETIKLRLDDVDSLDDDDIENIHNILLQLKKTK